ncbi:MAG: hypothetical protein WBF28_09370, partial [Atribacterota bacterium]
ISFEPEPDLKGETISNNPGVKKYYINPEKCFEFWAENTSDCSQCITVCPFLILKILFPVMNFGKKNNRKSIQKNTKEQIQKNVH